MNKQRFQPHASSHINQHTHTSSASPLILLGPLIGVIASFISIRLFGQAVLFHGVFLLIIPFALGIIGRLSIRQGKKDGFVLGWVLAGFSWFCAWLIVGIWELFQLVNVAPCALLQDSCPPPHLVPAWVSPNLGGNILVTVVILVFGFFLTTMSSTLTSLVFPPPASEWVSRKTRPDGRFERRRRLG